MLITKQEIAKHREVSRSVRDDKINPFIEDAEFLDLKPLLGDELYYELLNNKTDPKFQKILEPQKYEYKGTAYESPGLKKVIAIFAYSRYVLFGSFTDTAFGFVQKSNQDSDPVSDSHKRNIHTKEINVAHSYFNEVALYLNRHGKKYPNWKRCKSRHKTGLRISKIS